MDTGFATPPRFAPRTTGARGWPSSSKEGGSMRGKTRIMLAAASVAAVALVISLVSVSTAATVTKITVIEHAVTDTLVDTGNTTVVGTDQGDCIRIEAGVSWECRWTNFLEGGSIMVEGPYYDAGPSTIAITGGTGVYKDAAGTVKVSTSADATEVTFVFK